MASISVSIATGADDGRWRATAFSNSDDDTFIGAAANNKGFFRFTGLGALAGATITSATLTFVAAATDSGAASFVIKARAADNPPAPTTISEASSPARHATTVSWSSVAAWTAGTAYDSPDITTLIQALVDDGYLASGVILFYVEPASSGTGQRDAASYDHATYNPPALHVEYTTTVNKTASDADTVSAGETATVTELARSHNRTDAESTVSASESASIGAALASAGDSGTVTASEQATVAIVEGKSASDSGTITAAESSQLNVVKPSSDAHTVSAGESLAGMSAAVAASDAPTVTAGESLTLAAAVGAVDAGLVDAGETPVIMASLTSAGDSGTATAAETGRVAADVAATDSGAVTATESSIRTIIPIVTEPRIALDVYQLGGPRVGSGPITAVLAARYSGRADEIGAWSATVPATVENADELVRGREVRLRREGEGVVFRGVIDRADVTVGDRDERLLDIGGQSIAAELLWANTLLGRTFSGAPVSDAAATLLSGTGWNLGAVGSGPLVSSRFDGASIWAALREIAETFGWHLVEDNLTRSVTLDEVGSPSGLVLRQVDQPDPDLAVVPLTSLGIRDEQTELWNRIIPLGAGEGVNVLTLQRSTRAAPYSIQQATGPDGLSYWFLEDAASVVANGARTRVLKFDDVAPLSNSAAEVEAAANALYDVASAWLGYHANPVEFYEAGIAGLHHIDPNTSQRTFRVGQTARLQWRGVVEDEAGTRLWRSVDADVYLMGYEREFRSDGSDVWRLELATADRHAEGAGDRIVQAIEDLWAIKTAMKPYTYREIHGPFVESIDASNTASFPVDFDGNVTYLHQALLQLRKRRVKSNVTAAAAGGGQTSSATATAANAGGGQTSGGGTAHSHSVSGQTAQGSGLHFHVIAQANPTDPWSTPAYMQQMIWNTSPTGSPSYGVYVGRNGTSPVITSLVTQQTQDHVHTITATTSAAESSHTHGVSPHTHTINPHSHQISDHTHALTYGIYQGPTASTPQLTVEINGSDVTTALGGPWNNDALLDITPYLVDATGQPLRQTNSIEIGGSQLCDVEVTVKSLVTAMSLVPV